jgi:hypothetical protein
MVLWYRFSNNAFDAGLFFSTLPVTCWSTFISLSKMAHNEETYCFNAVIKLEIWIIHFDWGVFPQ